MVHEYNTTEYLGMSLQGSQVILIDDIGELKQLDDMDSTQIQECTIIEVGDLDSQSMLSMQCESGTIFAINIGTMYKVRMCDVTAMCATDTSLLGCYSWINQRRYILCGLTAKL